MTERAGEREREGGGLSARWRSTTLVSASRTPSRASSTWPTRRPSAAASGRRRPTGRCPTGSPAAPFHLTVEFDVQEPVIKSKLILARIMNLD